MGTSTSKNGVRATKADSKLIQSAPAPAPAPKPQVPNAQDPNTQDPKLIRVLKRGQPLHHTEAAMHAIRITKYHTSSGMKLYHLVYDNGKSHLIRVTAPDLFSFMSQAALEWYEAGLRMSTIKYRVDTTEVIPAKHRLEIDSSINFSSYTLPRACRKKSCFICRNERGYLNFNNGESEVWKKKRLLREKKEREVWKRKEEREAESESESEEAEEVEESEDDIGIEEESA